MIYKASWPLTSLGMAWVEAVGDEHLPPLSRTILYLPATKQLRQDLFQGRWIVVYFRGKVLPGGLYHVDEWVRQEDWLDRDPLTGELVP